MCLVGTNVEMVGNSKTSEDFLVNMHNFPAFQVFSYWQEENPSKMMACSAPDSKVWIKGDWHSGVTLAIRPLGVEF